MKILSFIYISILFISLASCNPNKEGVSNQAVIKGYTSNIEQGTYYLLKSTDAQDWQHFYKAQDSCIVDSSGHFQLNLSMKSAEFLQIRNSEGYKIHKNDFYLEPGDTLMIAVNDNSLELSGKASRLNNIALELDKWRVKDKNSKKRYSERRFLEPLDFIIYVDEIKNERLSIVQNHLIQEIPSSYQNYLFAKIHLQWKKDIWDFLKYHNYYVHGNWDYVSADSLGLNNVEQLMPDSNYHFIEDYWECIDGYVDYHYKTKELETSNSVLWQNMFSKKFSIVKNDLSGINRDIGLLNLSKEFWRFLSVPQNNFYKQAEIVNNYFVLNKQSEQYYSLFEQDYLEFMGIAPSKKAPDFRLENIRGEEVSLSDFLGKVVYIDFWGTWCGPCIKAIPKHLELQKSIKNNDDVVFLYVAMEYNEKDKDRWKKFISSKYWPGIHLVAKKQFKNEQLKPYKLTAAPTYVLINQAGNIVNPRASGPENILEDIERLLDK